MWGKGSKGRWARVIVWLWSETVADETSSMEVTFSFGVRCGPTEEGQKEGTSRVLPSLTWINAVHAVCLTWCSWGCRASTCVPPDPAPLTHLRKEQEFIKRQTGGCSFYQYRNSWIKMGTHGPLAPTYTWGKRNHFLFWCSPVVRRELHPNRKSWLWKTVLPLRAGCLTHRQRGGKRRLIED